jgi:hypothetical protein
MSYPLLEVARLLLLEGDTATANEARKKAVSIAYYAVFSEMCSIIANAFSDPENSPGLTNFLNYQRAFRVLDHNKLVAIARRVAGRAKEKPTKARGLKAKQPSFSDLDVDGLGAFADDKTLITFIEQREIWATNCIALQEARHSADYDPFFMTSLPDAEFRISQAEETLHALARIGELGRKQLAFDLVFPIPKQSSTS